MGKQRMIRKKRRVCERIQMKMRKKGIGNMLWLAATALLLLLLLPASASAETSHSFLAAGWSGKLTHLAWRNDIDSEFSLDLHFADEIFPFHIFPIPTLKMSVSYELGTGGDFDITLSKNLPAGTTLNSPIGANTEGIYKEQFTSNDGLLDAYLVAGATGKVRVKGSFRCLMKISLL